MWKAGRKTHLNKLSGFTLVEILLTLLILGLVSAIVIPRLSTLTEDTPETFWPRWQRFLRQVKDTSLTEDHAVYIQFDFKTQVWSAKCLENKELRAFPETDALELPQPKDISVERILVGEATYNRDTVLFPVSTDGHLASMFIRYKQERKPTKLLWYHGFDDSIEELDRMPE